MTDSSEDVTALWAATLALYDTKDFPEYGSPAWRALPPDSPHRLASVLEAAEQWRRHQAEQWRLDSLDPHDWYAEVFGHARAEASRLVALRRIGAVTAARTKFAEPHQLQATPGWPPVRIPGGGGRYLTYTNQEVAA
ncbi:hypothetical protein QMK19_30575 [Streptomyces sp. H10-C2]|uniref:hypothetical protein n=1 Tax=unclassified Streptomyces TaxID=2593676 RepID=UPI0024B9EB94|nr:MULTISPECIES: hypothetical protein [unclassified Streptomyces]MDJ0345954.1 hypothetical protein [Streptomyces sp. PH10-H1]MDJ0373879.1 hypothetical protein [Streptomyces sp. H10-C2]